jgi:plastocyanin
MRKWLILLAAAGSLAMSRVPQSQSHLVWQKDKQFGFPELEIAVGDTVVFSNEDEIIHNVFSTTEGQRFNVRRQLPGSMTPVIFSRRGSVLVRCAFHSSMKLSVIVR